MLRPLIMVKTAFIAILLEKILELPSMHQLNAIYAAILDILVIIPSLATLSNTKTIVPQQYNRHQLAVHPIPRTSFKFTIFHQYYRFRISYRLQYSQSILVHESTNISFHVSKYLCVTSKQQTNLNLNRFFFQHFQYFGPKPQAHNILVVAIVYRYKFISNNRTNTVQVQVSTNYCSYSTVSPWHQQFLSYPQVPPVLIVSRL